ncbi:MAG: hypothetical protein KA801_02205 [Syntrophorhabdaceae bacterium]|nr:hypothetical protein [Syntrophorhabdaceae bacterium]
MRIEIVDSIELKVKKLDFNLADSIEKILQYVPKEHMFRLSCILVADLPVHKSIPVGSQGAYFGERNKKGAHIELYFENIFPNSEDPDKFREMLVILQLSLATTIFHEIGHHVQSIRTHGVAQKRSEEYADHYRDSLWNKFLCDNAQAINDCFQHLEDIALSKGLRLDVINRMRSGWTRDWEKARMSLEPSLMGSR